MGRPVVEEDGMPVAAVLSGRAAVELARPLRDWRRWADEHTVLSDDLVAFLDAVELVVAAYAGGRARDSLSLPLAELSPALRDSSDDALVVSEVAEVLGVTDGYVRSMARRRLVAARKSGRDWVFDRDDVMRFAAGRQAG